MSFVFVDDTFVAELKQKVVSGSTFWKERVRELERLADEYMSKGPWSVTFIPSRAGSRDPHDFYSEAPYWWPDPKDPDGPYVRRDGDRNPDHFHYHNEAFEFMARTVLILAQASYFLGSPHYAERAFYLLRVWFLDKETLMNPNVDHGEAIINICRGRNAGIIVLRALDLVVHALGFIDVDRRYESEVRGMRAWFLLMMTWLQTSPHGVDESRTGNNHSAWWNSHVMALACYIGDDSVIAECCEYFKNYLSSAIAPDGSAPRELKRTRSFHYSLFNCDAMAVSCEAAASRGFNLWSYEAPNGASMEKAVRFLLPYMKNPSAWKYPELAGFIPEENYCMQLSSYRLGLTDAALINRKIRGCSALLEYHRPFGALVLLPGYVE